MKVKYVDKSKNVIKAVDKAAYKNFGHAAASISKYAKASLIRVAAPVPSAPGRPPHTHKGVYLRRAIRWRRLDGNKGAVIGPQANFVGLAGAVHEHGRRYKGARYPQRPFMEPALQANLKRFQRGWKGSIGG